MSNKRVYEVQELVPFKGWQPLSKPRNDVGVALDEFRAYVRTAGQTRNVRLLNTVTGRLIRSHKKPNGTSSAVSTTSRTGSRTAGTASAQAG